MSTETDNIFAAGLYNMLKGVRADIDVEKTIDAEITRAEGMAKLNNRIKQQSSPSGYVNKDTGKPILQSELANVSEDQRMLAGDFSIGQQKKQYNAQQDMTAAAKAKALQDSMAKEQRGYAATEARDKRGYAATQERDERGYAETQARDERGYAANKARDEARSRDLEKRAGSKGKGDSFGRSLKIEKLKDGMRERYEEYASGATGELGIVDKKMFGEDELEKPMSFKDWIKEFEPGKFDLIYGRQPRAMVANGEDTQTTQKKGGKASSLQGEFDDLMGLMTADNADEEPKPKDEKPKVAKKPSPPPKKGLYSGITEDPKATLAKGGRKITIPKAKKEDEKEMIKKAVSLMSDKERKRYLAATKSQKAFILRELMARL